MRIRVRDLIEELQRFPPDHVVEFNLLTLSKVLKRDRYVPFVMQAEFDRADQVGYEVKIQLAQT